MHVDVDYKGVKFRYHEELSCKGRCGFDISAVNCRCDPDCDLFRDCCFDYHEFCYSNSTSLSNPLTPILYGCHQLDMASSNLGSFLLVDKCPRQWTNEVIRALCESFPSYDSPHYSPFMNTIAKWRVFDENGDNFKNVFCAICNDKNVFRTQPWNYNVSFENDTFVPDKQYAYCSRSERVALDFHAGHIGKRLRHCIPSIVESCPESFPNVSISTACESYSAVSCPSSGGFVKNAHCALCNGLSVPFSPRPCSPYLSLKEGDFIEPVFYRLWNFQGIFSQFQHDPHSCSSQEIFDPLNGKCRSLSCPPGFVFDSETLTCQKPPSVPNAIHGICCAQQQTLIGYGEDFESIERPTSGNDCISDYINTVADSRDTNWINHIITTRSSTDMLLTNSLICNIGNKFDQAILKSDYLLDNCKIHALDYLHICNKGQSLGYCNGTWYEGTAEEFHLVNLTPLAEVVSFNHTFLIPQIVLDYVTYEYDSNSKTFVKKEIVLVCGEVIAYLNCPDMVTLTPDEYEMSSDNHSWINVFSSNSKLAAGEFLRLSDGRIQICSHFFENQTSKFFKYLGILDKVNVVGNSVSLLALVILIIGHCYFRKYEHFQGRSMMSLIIMLFWAYLLPLLSQKLQIVGKPCYVFAISSHFSWLAVFSWFTIISVGMTYTFVFRPTEPRDIRDARVSFRYVIPCIGWCVPILIVVICSVADFTGFGGFRYGSGSPCWISGPISNLIAFGGPVGASLLCNIACFLATAVSVWRGKAQHSKMTLKQQTKLTCLRDVMINVKVQCIGWFKKHVHIFGRHLSSASQSLSTKLVNLLKQHCS